MKENEVVLSHGVVSLLYTPSFFMPFLQLWCMVNGGAVVKARHVACSPDGSKRCLPAICSDAEKTLTTRSCHAWLLSSPTCSSPSFLFGDRGLSHWVKCIKFSWSHSLHLDREMWAILISKAWNGEFLPWAAWWYRSSRNRMHNEKNKMGLLNKLHLPQRSMAGIPEQFPSLFFPGPFSHHFWHAASRCPESYNLGEEVGATPDQKKERDIPAV